MKSLARLALLFLFASQAGNLLGQDYGKLMARKVQQVLGKPSTKGFKFASYPVDNFGVATMYDAGNKTEICAMFTCLVDDSDVPTDSTALLNVTSKSGKRFVDVGGGAPVTLTDEEKHSLAISVILPALMKVVGLTAAQTNTSDVNYDIALGAVHVRKIIKDRITDHVSSLPETSSERDAFDHGRLILVYQDIVADSLTVTMKFNGARNTDVNAKLTGVLDGNVGKIIGGDGTSASVKVDKTDVGTYKLTSTKPIILATNTIRQPSSGHLGTFELTKWASASAPNTVFTTAAPQ